MHVWWLAPESNIQVQRLHALLEKELIRLLIPDVWSRTFEEPTWLELTGIEFWTRFEF
jgi:hypothetical protein